MRIELVHTEVKAHSYRVDLLETVSNGSLVEIKGMVSLDEDMPDESYLVVRIVKPNGEKGTLHFSLKELTPRSQPLRQQAV